MHIVDIFPQVFGQVVIVELVEFIETTYILLFEQSACSVS